MSLEMLIDLDAFSGRAQSMGKEAAVKFREGMLAAASALMGPVE
jgi:hypothetical protein